MREQTSDISNQTKKSEVKKIDFLCFGIAEKKLSFYIAIVKIGCINYSM